MKTEKKSEPGEEAGLRVFVCGNCKYVHDGDKPPEVCPICGSPGEKFSSDGD